MHALLIASWISFSSMGVSARYFSMIVSSTSAKVSIRPFLALAASSLYPSGIGRSSNSMPWFPSFQTISLSFIRSNTPPNDSSDPDGMLRINGLTPSRSFNCPITPQKSAPSRSILFMKAILGTPYLSAWCHTVSDWGSTPPTAQKTPIAPSSTLKDLSTSMVKSTCPGVSMICISLPCQ